MRITEVQRDLFEVNNHITLAHCISSDYALGAGIAVEFNKRFDMRNQLRKTGDGTFPSVVSIGRVYNLVTKEKYWHKPTYENLEKCLQMLKEELVAKGITSLAMPRIGSGLDRLEWGRVRRIIMNVFSDTSINIVICFI